MAARPQKDVINREIIIAGRSGKDHGAAKTEGGVEDARCGEAGNLAFVAMARILRRVE